MNGLKESIRDSLVTISNNLNILVYTNLIWLSQINFTIPVIIQVRVYFGDGIKIQLLIFWHKQIDKKVRIKLK